MSWQADHAPEKATAQATEQAAVAGEAAALVWRAAAPLRRDPISQPAAKAASAPLALLAVETAGAGWLLDLPDGGEIVPFQPLAPLTPVPLTEAWFLGMANVRGNLYAVSDFAAFLGGPASRITPAARLLLVGSRYGSNAALLVERIVGLKAAEGFTPLPAPAARPAWEAGLLTAKDGKTWKKLGVAALLADRRFMEIGR